MKFERLPVPEWELPDLVAFNQRVHDRIDPWWERKWVRRGTWTFVGLFTFFAAIWIYFASGLPSSQTLLAYQPPLPTNVRGYDGTPIQTFARERRVELSAPAEQVDDAVVTDLDVVRAGQELLQPRLDQVAGHIRDDRVDRRGRHAGDHSARPKRRSSRRTRSAEG